MNYSPLSPNGFRKNVIRNHRSASKPPLRRNASENADSARLNTSMLSQLSGQSNNSNLSKKFDSRSRTSTEVNKNKIAIFEKQISKLSKTLDPDEEERYGDRIAKGLKKICLLGKGEKTLVWLAQDANGEKVAMK